MLIDARPVCSRRVGACRSGRSATRFCPCRIPLAAFVWTFAIPHRTKSRSVAAVSSDHETGPASLSSKAPRYVS